MQSASSQQTHSTSSLPCGRLFDRAAAWHLPCLQVYSDAAQACSAITERLSMSSGHGPFFFGAKPCSFDALLYGLLAFQQASPVTSPEMKQQVGQVSPVALHVSMQLATLGWKRAEQTC